MPLSVKGKLKKFRHHRTTPSGSAFRWFVMDQRQFYRIFVVCLGWFGGFFKKAIITINQPILRISFIARLFFIRLVLKKDENDVIFTTQKNCVTLLLCALKCRNIRKLPRIDDESSKSGTWRSRPIKTKFFKLSFENRRYLLFSIACQNWQKENFQSQKLKKKKNSISGSNKVGPSYIEKREPRTPRRVEWAQWNFKGWLLENLKFENFRN